MAPRWTGQIILGTGFWLLLCLIAFAVIAWRFGWFREGRLVNMLSYSITGNRDLALKESLSKN